MVGCVGLAGKEHHTDYASRGRGRVRDQLAKSSTVALREGGKRKAIAECKAS